MRKTLLVAALFAFAGSAFAAPVTYKLDPTHTNVLASWDHFGFSNPSVNFGQADGTLVYDADKVSASSVQVTLPLSGLSALADQFYDHLTSDKWFDAAKYPTATFKSTQVEAAGEGKLKVTGDLTMHGVTKPVTVSMEKLGEGQGPGPMGYRSGFVFATKIKRSDFGMNYGLDMVGDDVTVNVSFEGVRQVAPAAQ